MASLLPCSAGAGLGHGGSWERELRPLLFKGSRLRFELSYSRSSLKSVKSLNKLFKKKQPEFST